MNQKPRYMDKQSTQTLREGLTEYYSLNPHVTDPATQPSDFAKVLRAHDVGHVLSTGQKFQGKFELCLFVPKIEYNLAEIVKSIAEQAPGFSTMLLEL